MRTRLHALLPAASLLLLCSTVAGAAEPREPSPYADADTEELVIYSEPPKRGDDRVASRIEALLRAQEPALRACRSDHLAEAPNRFVQYYATFSLKGKAKRMKQLASTDNKAVDTCVRDLISSVKLDPPPRFSEVYEIALTWRIPTPPEDDDKTTAQNDG